MNRDTQSFLAPSDSIPPRQPPPWRRRRVAQASASEPWRDADQPIGWAMFAGYIRFMQSSYTSILLIKNISARKFEKWDSCCNWFLREIHHYRTQKSQHVFGTVLLEQKSVVFLNTPIIITVSLVIILESYWYLSLLKQYYYYSYYYAQTSQFAHTTVEGILRGMLNFISIQMDYSTCFNRVCRES